MSFLVFNEGKTDLINNGLPATCTFDLSTKTTAELGEEATYAGGYGVATGTTYAAKTASEPTASKGKAEFTKLVWETLENTDWPSGVKSVVMRNGTTHLLCAWDLAATRNMAAKNTKLEFTPTITQSFTP